MKPEPCTYNDCITSKDLCCDCFEGDFYTPPALFDCSHWDTDEIGNWFSDRWKDVYDARPRHIRFDNREALIAELNDLMNNDFAQDKNGDYYLLDNKDDQ